MIDVHRYKKRSQDVYDLYYIFSKLIPLKSAKQIFHQAFNEFLGFLKIKIQKLCKNILCTIFLFSIYIIKLI